MKAPRKEEVYVREVLGTGTITLVDLNDATISTTAPSNPEIGEIWLDVSSGNKHILKKYNGRNWVKVELDLSDLDPEAYRTITDNVSKVAHLFDDNILTPTERGDLHLIFSEITGRVLSTKTQVHNLPSVQDLDAQGTGSFATYRANARKVGISTHETLYSDLESAYRELEKYNSTYPRLWDVRENITTNTQVDAQELRERLLNYYQAELRLVSETEGRALKLTEEYTDLVGSKNSSAIDFTKEQGIDTRNNAEALNLILDSAVSTSNSNQAIKTYRLAQPLVAHKEYTLTIWGNLPDEARAFINTTGNSGSFAETVGGDNYLKQIGNGVYSLTVKLHEYIPNYSTHHYLYIRSGVTSPSRNATIDKIMLSEGSEFRNWTVSAHEVTTPTVYTGVSVPPLYSNEVNQNYFNTNTIQTTQYSASVLARRRVDYKEWKDTLNFTTTGGTSTLKARVRAVGLTDLVNQKITLSFDVVNRGTDTVSINTEYLVNTTPDKILIEPNEEKQVVFTGTLWTSYVSFFISTIVASTNVDIVIGNGKIEIGNTPTPWVPYVDFSKGYTVEALVFMKDTIPNSVVATDNLTEGGGNLFKKEEYNPQPINIDGFDYSFQTFPTRKGKTYSITTDIPDLELINSGSQEYGVGREFINTVDLAPILNKYGTDRTYTISFDLKSASTENNNTMRVYMQNGSASLYTFTSNYLLTVTQNYQRFTLNNVTFNNKNNNNETKALLAFYGTYNTGNHPRVRNIKITTHTVSVGNANNFDYLTGTQKTNLVKNTVTDTPISPKASLTATGDDMLLVVKDMNINGVNTINGLRSGKYKINISDGDLSRGTFVMGVENQNAYVSYGEYFAGYVGRNLLEGGSDNDRWHGVNPLSPAYPNVLQVNISHVYPKVQKGDTLTISFDVWSEKDQNLQIYDTNGQYDFGFGVRIIPIEAGTERRSVTVALDKAGRESNSWILDFYNQNSDIPFSITNLKIEKGHIATPYSPAPEDLEDLEELTDNHDTSSNVKISQWHRLSATSNGTNLKLYVDGEQVGGEIPAEPLNVNSLLIGADTLGNGFHGYLADFRIWSIELTPQEITENLVAEIHEGTPNILLNYKFKGGQKIYDSGPFQNHIPVSNNTRWVHHASALKDVESSLNINIEEANNRLENNLIVTNTQERLNMEGELRQYVNTTVSDTAGEIINTTSSNLSQTASTLRLDYQNVANQTTNLQREIDNYNNYFEFDGANGHFSVGAKDSPYKIRLSKDRLSFLEGSSEVAYISNSSMKIASGVFVDSLIVGEHKFESGGNGVTIVSWMGN